MPKNQPISKQKHLFNPKTKLENWKKSSFKLEITGKTGRAKLEVWEGPNRRCSVLLCTCPRAVVSNEKRGLTGGLTGGDHET